MAWDFSVVEAPTGMSCLGEREHELILYFEIKLYIIVALNSFSYLQTPPGTPSNPHEFLNKSISRILFISTLCTAIILLLWLHPLCHLSPVCLQLVSIKYLLLLYSFTTSAFAS